MIKYIKFIFYIIPIIIIFLKSIDNIFIESIKMKYSDVPGKLSDFSIIISFLGRLLVALDFIFFLVYIVLFFAGSINLSSGATDISLSKYSILGIVLVVILIINIYLTSRGYSIIRSKYINMLEEKNDTNMLKEKNDIKINKVLNKYLLKDFGNKSLKLNIILSYFNTAIYGLLLVVYIIDVINNGYNENSERGNMIFLSCILLGCLIMSVISNSLKKALSEMNEKKEYIFIYEDDQSIKTKLYLDFKDKYLIIKEGYEIFIPKNIIKRKIVRHKEIS